MADIQTTQNKRYRIGFGSIISILFIAGIFDITSLVPFVGDFVAPVFWIGLSWYLWKTGHGILNWKIVVPETLSLVSEFIPGVQALPTMITAGLVIIAVSRFEDKTGISLIPLGVRLPTKNIPLNIDGKRMPTKE